MEHQRNLNHLARFGAAHFAGSAPRIAISVRRETARGELEILSVAPPFRAVFAGLKTLPGRAVLRKDLKLGANPAPIVQGESGSAVGLRTFRSTALPGGAPDEISSTVRTRFFSAAARAVRVACYSKCAAFCVVLAIASLLVGCHRERSSAKKLHLFAWSEYVPKEVIDGFTKETGIPVDYEVYDSNEAMVAKLAPGSAQYDVIQPSEYTVEALVKRKMLATLDLSKIPNLSNILPEFLNLSYDPGNQHSVPYMAGTTGIVINTDKIKEPIRGYADVFQEKYARRIIAVDDNREIVSWAFATAGIDINDVTPENLAKVKPMLKSWIPLVKIFDSNDPKGPLLRGEVDLGVVYCGDAAKLIEQDKKFKYILPIEGAHRFIDNLCIPAGSQNKEAAEAFINYTLRPEVSKIISDKFPYTNPNGAARKLLTPEQLANPASYPPNSDKLELFRDIGKSSVDISNLMTELRG